MTPYYDSGQVTLYQGDMREELAKLEPESVHMAVTSPPYLALRDYDIAPTVLGGDPACDHSWENSTTQEGYAGKARWQHSVNGQGREELNPSKLVCDPVSREARPEAWTQVEQGAFCARCGAWRGVLGLEPTVELYVAHIVEVFRAVRRVLRKDGTLWLNIGDSYAANRSYQVPDSKHVDVGNNGSMSVPPGLKPGDLMGVPWRVALAMQAAGWWLRSAIVWEKPNPMPESVSGWRWERCRIKVKPSARAKGGAHVEAYGEFPQGERDGREFLNHVNEYADCPGCKKCLPNDGLVLRRGSWRPTSSYEYIFMFAKSANYFSDGEPLREPHKDDSIARYFRNSSYNGDPEGTQYAMKQGPIGYGIAKSMGTEYGADGRGFRGHSGYFGADGQPLVSPAGRNARDVWRFPTAPFGDQLCTACKTYYEAHSYHRLQNGNSPQCQTEMEDGEKCMGTSFVSLDGSWMCLSCKTVYSVAALKTLPKARRCRVCKRDDAWLSHFATFPPELPKRCILAGTSERGVCATCGAPWARVIQRTEGINQEWAQSNNPTQRAIALRGEDSVSTSKLNRGSKEDYEANHARSQTLGWRPTCGHESEPVPAVVLDPFVGSGTTCVAATALGRRNIGIDLNQSYLDMGKARCRQLSLM